MKQTAVEWLENEFQEICKDFGGLHSDFIVKFKQAKAMEKEQIIDAYEEQNVEPEFFEDGTMAITNKYTDAEEYYNETFKSE